MSTEESNGHISSAQYTEYMSRKNLNIYLSLHYIYNDVYLLVIGKGKIKSKAK